MGTKKRVQKKNFVKKEVEEYLPLSKKIIKFIYSHAKECFAMLSVCIVLIASIFLWNVYRANQEVRASVLFSDAFNYYSKAIEEGNLSDYETASIKFLDLLNKFPSTSVGKKSHFFLGNCYYWLKDYTNAEKHYKNFIDKSSKKEIYLRTFSYEGLGYAAEQTSKFDLAIEYFKKASKGLDDHNKNVTSLMNQARVYEEMNQKDKAIEIYQNLMKDIPESKEATIAKQKISSLSLK